MDYFKVRLVGEYQMPPLCCACGQPAGPARFKVYAPTWSSRRPYGLFFPLCPACEQAYRAVDRRRRIGCWAGLGLALLVAVGGILGEALGLGAGALSGLAWGLFFGAIALGLVAYAIIPLFLPRQVRAPYRRVLRAVEIHDYRPARPAELGSMVLAFNCPPFAEAFRQLNEAVAAHR